MRIDLVITELFVGGAERCLTELAIGLQQSGDEVRVFSLGRLPTGQQASLVDRLRGEGIEVVAGESDRAIELPKCYRRLKTWLARRPADVCQTFLYHANVLGTGAARAAGVPHCVGGLRVAETRWLRCRIEMAAARRMDRLVCVSEQVREFAHCQLRCPPSQTAVISNGVDTTRFANASPVQWHDFGWPNDAVVSLFVGRLHPQKGLELLQRQIDRIAPANSKYRLLIVGSGPLQSPLQRWCERIGAQRVQLLPWQPDVAPLMRAARVLVLPSYYEGMPNVVMEAMAASRPVVCSRVEGTAELFAHQQGSADGRTQQTFTPGSEAEMALRLETFLADKTLAGQVGAENQVHVRQHFSIPAMVDAYRSLYRDLWFRDRSQRD